MPPSSKIIELRELLAAKHPGTPLKSGGFLPTGLIRVDAALQGGLPLGGMTEIVCMAGGGLLLAALIRDTHERSGLLALIDAGDAFDPCGVPRAALQRLLWVRSQTTVRAIQAADLLLRDGNLNLVVLDLRSSLPAETRKVPSTSWYRLQRVVEPAATAFVVLTSQPLVSGARPRLVLEGRFGLEAFNSHQHDLTTRLQVKLVRGHEEAARQFA